MQHHQEHHLISLPYSQHVNAKEIKVLKQQVEKYRIEMLLNASK